jgi:hypothetical protein
MGIECVPVSFSITNFRNLYEVAPYSIHNGYGKGKGVRN